MEPIFTTQTQFDLEEYIKFNEALLSDRHNDQLRSIKENNIKNKKSLKRIWIMVAVILLTVAFLNLLAWLGKGGLYPEFTSLIMRIVNILGAIALGIAILATLLQCVILLSPPILKRLEKKSAPSMRKSLEKSYNSNVFNQKNSLWSYSFFDDYLEEKTENSYEKFEYSMIHKVIENDSNFYIMKSENQGYIIVKNNCSPELIAFIRDLKRKNTEIINREDHKNE